MKGWVIHTFYRTSAPFLYIFSGRFLLSAKKEIKRKEDKAMYPYNPHSQKAEEFINHEEILETLAYAEENKHNIP